MSTRKEFEDFARELRDAAEFLDKASVNRRGQKVASQRVRVALSEIKREITRIKRLTMGESK